MVTGVEMPAISSTRIREALAEGARGPDVTGLFAARGVGVYRPAPPVRTATVTATNPTTFLVGAGPVATALAGALRLGGVPVLGLWARRPAPARAAGSTAGVAAFSSAPPDLLLEAEIVILAVRDQVIGEVAQMLAGTGLLGKRHVLLHCAGAASSRELLAGVAEQVGGIGTLHPLSAIADGKAAMRALRGTVFGVEGDERGRAAATALVGCMSGVVLPLDGSQMAAYHAAAALASNYVVAALDAAAAALASAGVDPEAAARAGAARRGRRAQRRRPRHHRRADRAGAPRGRRHRRAPPRRPARAPRARRALPGARAPRARHRRPHRRPRRARPRRPRRDPRAALLAHRDVAVVGSPSSSRWSPACTASGEDRSSSRPSPVRKLASTSIRRRWRNAFW